MELALCNTQSELHPLEEGKHAAESGLDLKAYVKESNPGLNDDQLKAKYRTLYDKVQAWRVFSVLHVQNEATREAWRNLTAIASARPWIWSALVKAMLEGSWTVPQAELIHNPLYKKPPVLWITFAVAMRVALKQARQPHPPRARANPYRATS